MGASIAKASFMGKRHTSAKWQKKSALPLLFQKPNPGTKPGSVNKLVLSPCVTEDPALLSKSGYWPDCQNQRNEETAGKGKYRWRNPNCHRLPQLPVVPGSRKSRRLHQNDSLDPGLQEGGTKLSLLGKSGFPGLTVYSEGSTWL